MKKSQMTVPASSDTGASSTPYTDWKAIDWLKAVIEVRRLQMRIANAFREGRHNKVKALQWILTHSYSAKLLAVKRVVENKGSRTSGVDGVLWKTSKQKIAAVNSLKRRGYKTKPLKRTYIVKKQKGKFRSLSIPAMSCRAQQALYLLALEPVAEMMADKNSYGFRPLRSTADAIEQCFKSLCQKTSAQYILEGDIKACFDSISHQWLQRNVPLDKVMLKKWLTAGYIERGKKFATTNGTPQGGIISPTILTVTLSGLDAAVKAVTKPRDKVNVCVYADDFIITGATKEILEEKVKPMVESFLKDRGLTLSTEKTAITHINEGFNFLGANIRKYKSKLIIKPAKSNVKRFLCSIRETIKNNATMKTENLIQILNPKIRGWINYHRHICAKKTFSYVDHAIFKAIWRWCVRRHPEKGNRWVKKKYFRNEILRNWIFSTKVKDKLGKPKFIDLISASATPIKRHIKLRATATPYDPIYHDYLDERVRKSKNSNWMKTWWQLLEPKINKKDGLHRGVAS